MTNGIRVERDGPVTTVILDRPEVRNAVDRSAALALAEAFAEFEADDDALAAVLWGGNGTFCAGADLKALSEDSGSGVLRFEPHGNGPIGPSRMRLSKPVIGAISGYAVAGGIELALFCDMRVAESDAILGVFCRRWGVPLIDGGTVRLPRIVGLGRALDMILTGRPVDAAEALQMGLVNRVVEPGRARAEAESIAHQIAAFPQLCMRADRWSAYNSLGTDFEDAMRAEYANGTEALAAEGFDGAARFAGGQVVTARTPRSRPGHDTSEFHHRGEAT